MVRWYQTVPAGYLVDGSVLLLPLLPTRPRVAAAITMPKVVVLIPNASGQSLRLRGRVKHSLLSADQ